MLLSKRILFRAGDDNLLLEERPTGRVAKDGTLRDEAARGGCRGTH
jgi:hypothetical protein